MRILGVDPGLSTAGIGLIETGKHPLDLRALDWMTITTNAGLPLPERLLELGNDLEEFLTEAKADIAVVEKLFFATNKKTAMETAQARGVIILTLKRHGIEVIDATPLQLKTAITGDGQADKLQMQTMVKRILNLPTLPTPADAADALGLAIYGAHHATSAVAVSTMPSPRTAHVRRPVI